MSAFPKGDSKVFERHLEMRDHGPEAGVKLHHSPKKDASEEYKDHEGALKSPMVGTCYLAPEPGAANFINLGDTVQKDQPVLIIEAMKVMNLIKAHKAGTVTKIAVKNSDPVEYGQILLVIE
jgi:acetyl-CoA carboxylase biotin carboxyl carrier protein